jgi:hypothetical protein
MNNIGAIEATFFRENLGFEPGFSEMRIEHL